MRVLVAASGGEGHLGPLLPFADAARAAGHEVIVVVPPEQEETVLRAGHRYELSAGVPAGTMRAIRAAMATGSAEDRVELAEVELFGRACTTAALPTLEAVCVRFRPQLILREPCDYASAIVAHRGAVPMAQVAISPGRADSNGLHRAAPVVEPLAPGVTSAIERSPYLTRFPELDSGFRDTRAYAAAVGIAGRRTEDPPVVWITFGTVNSAFPALESTWRAVLAAVDGLPVRVVASVGRGGGSLDAPAHVDVVDWVELPEILARAGVVVCHGGSGTTLATLAAGIPLLVIPLIADQPANARMVEQLGAGIAVTTEGDGTLRGLGPADVPRVRAAITALLTDGGYAAAAERVAQQLRRRATVPEVLAALRDPSG